MRQAGWTLGLLGGLAGAWFATLGRGHLAEIGRLHAGIDASYREVEATEQMQAEARLQQQRHDRLLQWHAELQTRLRLDPVTRPPLFLTTAALERAGLAIESADVLADEAGLDLPHQRQRLVVSGRFADLFQALAGLEHGAPPARLLELRLRGNGNGRVRAECTLLRTWSLP